MFHPTNGRTLFDKLEPSSSLTLEAARLQVTDAIIQAMRDAKQQYMSGDVSIADINRRVAAEFGFIGDDEAAGVALVA